MTPATIAPRRGASGRLEQRALGRRVPTSVTFQITDRCNYDCVHCYQEHDQDAELSTEEALDVLQQVADAGVLFLTVLGGEVFVRRDADQLLTRAHELGFAIRLKTTGHHVHDRRADLLASLRPLQVDLSVYGAHAPVHDAVTQQPGSLQRTLDAARRLIERGVHVELKVPVMEENAGEIEALAALARAMGASYSLDPKIVAMQNGDASPLVRRMGEEALARFYGETAAEVITDSFRDRERPARNPLGSAPCGAAHKSCFINPEGEVWPCLALPMPVGHLRRERFLDVWRDARGLEEVRNLRWATLAECNECPVREYCQRCHGMALVEHGEIAGPSLEACRHAVAVRDELRQRGLIPQSETALPPTWDRVGADGHHAPSRKGKRSRALRVL